MEKLRAHYTGSTGSSLLTDSFKFWTSSQTSHESIQEWEVKVRQASSLCAYGELTDELTRDKFIFGLNEDHTRTELLKTHVKPDNSKKTLQDVVAEARARVCLEDRKFKVPDSRSQASNTRSVRKEYTNSANGKRLDSRLSGQRQDPRANTSTQSRDLHYTDMYVTEEQL